MMKIVLLETKRLGRYHNYDHSINNNNDDSYPPHFSDVAQLYKGISQKSLLDWNKPLFEGNSLHKVFANANRTVEKSTKFINKIKSNQESLLVLPEPNQYLKMQQ